jgi:hypothetical protein
MFARRFRRAVIWSSPAPPERFSGKRFNRSETAIISGPRFKAPRFERWNLGFASTATIPIPISIPIPIPTSPPGAAALSPISPITTVATIGAPLSEFFGRQWRRR